MALDNAELIAQASNPRLGYSRAFAIEALAARALDQPRLLDIVCPIISQDNRIGFHAGMPLGWLGADKIFLSGQELAMKRLFQEMDSWQASEQEDLVRHWAGNHKLAQLTAEFKQRFAWNPRYKIGGE